MTKLTAKQRKKIPTAKFGLPEKRAFPIEDPNHARNALARASQFATPEQQAEIRSKVKARFPDIKVKGK